MSDPHAVLIAGPTASGKSAFALQKAQQVRETGREPVIVNADSMQVYPVLRVLTARPSAGDMGGIEHVLYGHAALERPYSVAQWGNDVNAVLGGVKTGEVIPIFVGGTGLYFRALEQGLSPVPPIEVDIRTAVRVRLVDGGAPALHAELMAVDPKGAASLRPSDGQRIARALEVFLSTGTPLSAHHERRHPALLDGWGMEKYILEPARDVLHDRIAEAGGTDARKWGGGGSRSPARARSAADRYGP